MILGKSIFLRAMDEDDLPLLLAWLNDPVISRLVGGWTYPTSMTEQKEWFKRTLQDRSVKRLIVQSPVDGVIGLTGLWEIDWQNRHALTALKIGASDIRGKGYGTDAIMTMMAYAFHTIGLNRLWGLILEYNIPSYKAYVEKCGWKVEGINRQHIYRDGKYHNQLRVGILRDEFYNLPNAKDYVDTELIRSTSPIVKIKDEHKANNLD